MAGHIAIPSWTRVKRDVSEKTSKADSAVTTQPMNTHQLVCNRVGIERWLVWIIIVFALTNGILYSLLLPLWEGFDEPFHYGYVQELSTRHRLPVLAQSSLSREIWDSLLLVPVSHVVQKNIPVLRTFVSYFALPIYTRSELRQRLTRLATDDKYDTSVPHGNYEAHQPPLAYLVLAFPDSLLSNCSLLTRVRALRLFSVVLAILLTAGAATALCSQLEMRSPFRELVLLFTFSSQMFYATTAHICNDWLAVPLVSWLIVAAIRSYSKSSFWSTASLALVFSLGLLTKAYFLAFIPLFLAMSVVTMMRMRLSVRAAATGILIVGIVAGPWYLRNLSLYGSLSGMPENVAGIGLHEVIRTAPSVPWAESAAYMARASLWTGNNQFNTFSRATLNTMLFLLCIGGCYYLAGFPKYGRTVADVVILAAISLFIVALAYSTIVSFVYTHGASAGASPWYMQVLLVPVMALIVRGLSRGGRIARGLACADVVLWSYVIVATYVLKLLPQYGGYDLKLTHITDVAKWYVHNGTQRYEVLYTTTLGPPAILYGLLVAVGLFSILTSTAICRMLLRAAPTASSQPVHQQ